MDAVKELLNIDFPYAFLSVFAALAGARAIVSLLEWTAGKFGLETKWMRRRREEHDLLVRTSQNLAALQENHIRDMEESIKALMRGNKELLGAEIDKRYREYISLNGIPEPEVDEFDDIFSAYKHLNGNHRRDKKYSYIKDHLRVIPVETKLVTRES